MIGMDITKGQVLRYTLLPEVLPRMKSFFQAGFGNLAYFMALVYRAVNILPANHPYLKAGATGQYSIRNVLSEAANHLIFDSKHIDQVIVFFALIAGIIILVIQFFFLLIAVSVNPASAADMPANYAEFFTTKSPTEDLALRMLDKVFGIPEIFGSKETTNTEFHQALHHLFSFYSVGLLVIAAMIIIYYIFAVLAETAQTGTPFGKRYNHVWAPIRLVAAIGLLIPISHGMNSGQWITLYAAKYGSGFATNGWIKFNETLNNTPISKEQLAATPKPPDLKDIVAFMMMAHACREGYDIIKSELMIDAYLIEEKGGGKLASLTATDFEGALEFFESNVFHIRIGTYNEVYAEDTANVHSYCGDITLTISDTSGLGELDWGYYTLLQELWENNYKYKRIGEAAKNMVTTRLDHDKKIDPGAELKTDMMKRAKDDIKDLIKKAVEDAQDSIDPDKDYKKLGWASAGIWYNKIASINGQLTTAAMNKPQVASYPRAMSVTCEKNKQQDNNVSPNDCYNTRLSKGKKIEFPSKKMERMANALSDIFDYWYKDPADGTGGAFINTVNAIFGTQALFDMCENANIHPLAQLSSVGKGMVEAAIRNLGFSLGMGVAGILTPYFGPALEAASGFLSSVASIGILIGFILYYLVPFMPFLYFLFAVGGWVKGLFEAMVGVPLWALAHLRIDGEGLPGDAAINGYFLIFEIFIRPILIVFGLLASILVFGAMVKVLNDIFALVVSNLSGFSSGGKICGTGGGSSPTGSIEYFRGPVDEFFFTIVYAIIVYMIGMSSFKLIDLIPNNILRWMGAGVSSFNDQAGEPAEGLISKMAIGGGMMTQQLQIAGNFKDSMKGIGGGIKDVTTG